MTEGHFRRVLGRRDALALAFGAIIGWSWVLLTGQWVALGGSLGAMLAFTIGGVAMIFIGLTYAELVSAMPEAGGEHVYSHRALGAGGSFVCTWALILAYVTVVAFEAVALATALDYLLPDIRRAPLWTVAGEPVYLGWVVAGIGAAVLITGINVVGIRPAAVLQSVVTTVILVAGLMFVTGTLSGGSVANLEPWFVAGVAGVMQVLIMVPTMFVGFDVIPQAAEEIRLPHRAIGSVVILSVLLALGWYLLMILGVALIVPGAGRDGLTLATADANALAWGGRWAGNLMVLGGIAGILTSWNAFLVGASRVVYAMARDGLLPGWLGALHPRFGTPHRAVLLVGSTACISPLFGRRVLVWLIDAGSFALVIAFGFVAWSFLVLRRREPGMPRPFRAGRGNGVGYAALLMSALMLLIYLPGSPSALVWPYEWVICLAWAALGALLYRAAPGRG